VLRAGADADQFPEPITADAYLLARLKEIRLL
jgi:hypothetical protein